MVGIVQIEAVNPFLYEFVGAEGISPTPARALERVPDNPRVVDQTPVTCRDEGALSQAKFRVNRVFARTGDIQQ
jgi:hypothetical protein